MPTPAALARAAATARAWTLVSPRGRTPRGDASLASLAGASAMAVNARTATSRNAQRQPNRIATAGRGARPAGVERGTRVCAPNARPCRCTATSCLSRALTDGPPNAFATPPAISSAVRLSADCASVAMARHETAVAIAASRMPASAPIRSTNRPAGVALSAHITWKRAIASPTRESPNAKSSGSATRGSRSGTRAGRR